MFTIFLCMHGFAALKFDFINISVRAAVHCVTSTMKILLHHSNPGNTMQGQEF